MKTKHLSPFIVVLALCAGRTLAEPMGSAFTYQGCLKDGATVASGSYDLQFKLYDAAAAGSQVAATVTVAPVAVSNGLFTVTLDYGGASFSGEARWLEISVRTNGSVIDYAILSPRQPLTPAPYALHAATAPIADSSINSGKIADGSVANIDMAPNAVTTDKILDGTVTGADLANNVVGSMQLADDVELGSISANGELTLWSDANNTESLRLYGATHTIDIQDNSGDRTVSLTGGGAAGGAATLWGADGTLRLNLEASSAGADVLLRDSTATGTVQLRGGSGGQIDVTDSFNVLSALGGTRLARLEKGSGGGLFKTYDEAGVLTGTFGSSAGIGGYIELRTRTSAVGLRLDGDDGGAGYVAINSTNGSARVMLDGYGSGGGGEVRLANTNGASRLSFFGQGANGAGEVNVFDTSGTETIEILGQQNSSLGSRITLRQSSGVASLTLNGEYGMAGEGSAILLNNGAGSLRLRLEGDNLDAGYAVVYGTNGVANVSLNGNAGGKGRVTTQELHADQLRIISTSVTLGAGDTLTPTSGYVRVISTGGSVTLNATTAIADGSASGTILILEGRSEMDTVTIPTGANTRLGGNRRLAFPDTLMLIWNGSYWVELSYASNL